MNKKTLILTICAILVVIALAVSLIFIFSGDTENPDQTGGDKAFSLTGTWLVVANYVNDSPVFTDGQFMIFTDTNAAMYKDATGDAFAQSSYTVNEVNQLILSDISREYKIDKKTDNCIRLYDTATTYMLLVRNSKSEREVEVPTVNSLAGKWNVTLKGDVRNNGEVLEFEGSTLKYYRNAASAPAATPEYTLQGSKLNVSAMGLNMRCYIVNANTIICVEDGGIVWELSK